MSQICRQTVLQKHKACNVLPQVAIRPDMEQHWFDALCQFANMMRMQNGINHVVSIENEEGFIDNAGVLVIKVNVSTETLQMSLPAGTWGWKDGGVPVSGV